jgi:hypothetical protein
MRSSRGKRHAAALAVLALGVVFALTYVVPAVGGPQAFSSASPTQIAKKALKTAKKADRRAKQAKKSADSANAILKARKGVLSADVRTVSSADTSIAQGAVQIVAVQCPAGTTIVSGGYSLIGPEAHVFSNRRSGNGWAVGGDNTAAVAGPATLTVDAQCAATGQAVASGHRQQLDRKRDQELLEQQRAAHRR